jgi:ADP-ribose pyrophosphatase YjhB (NUDIX family)
MPISPYLAGLRARVGTDLLLVPAAGAAVFDDDGRLLLARHADDGGWATPGGMVEPGERPADAAVRELREETGIEAEVVGLVGAYGGPDYVVTYPNGDRTAYVVTVYACRPTGGGPRPDGVEVLEVGWFDAEEVARRARPSSLAEIVPDAFAWWAAHGRDR